MHTCYFCNATVPSTEYAIAAGWYPSFWFDEKEESGEPCCEACAIKHLDFEDGEPTLKAEGSDRTAQMNQTDQPSQPSDRTGD